MPKLSHTARSIVDMVQYRKNEIKKENANIRAQKKLEEQSREEYNSIYERAARSGNVRDQYNKFVSDTKKVFMVECVMKLLNESTSIVTHDTQDESIKRSLVDNFIEENGVESLLNRFKKQNLLLSEFYNAITKAYKTVLEGVDKTDPDTFVIKPEVKDTFFDDLDMTNSEEAIINIRNRVIEAEEEFVQSNKNDKMQIDSILQDAKEKIEGHKSDAVKESVNMRAKSLISDVKYNKKSNIYNAMIESFTESIPKVEALQTIYTENGLFNMDKINENVNVIYTFLECINTTQMVKVDESYIQSFINDLKA